MANLRDIKNRIESVTSTRQITRTMEMVSTAKIKRAQAAIEAARPYALSMMEVLGNVARYVQGASHPLLQEHDKRERVAFVVITSDRGLCGGFNANILRLMEQAVAEERSGGAEIDIIAIGKKAVGYMRYRGVEPLASYTDISDRPTFDDARDVALRLTTPYEAEDLDAAYVIFNHFRSVADQKAELHQLLPIARKVMEESEESLDLTPEYVLEPEPDVVLDHLLPTYVETLVYRALMESAASEHAARRTAMKAATDNASEMITTLTRSYNRARQAAITNEIAEIVGGAAALEDA